MTMSRNQKSKLSPKQQALLKKRLAQRKTRIPRQPHQDTALASLAQNRLWLENELASHNAVYNIARRLQLNGRLHISALEKSLAIIIERHEALRTTFAMEGDKVVQKIKPASSFVLPFIDLTSLSELERTAQAELLTQEEAKRPFDLTEGSLIRAQLLRLSEEEHILLFTLHHIIADGWSMNIFMQELTAAYQAYCQEKTPNLPPLTIQYSDYARWQEERLKSAGLQRQQDFWLEQLRGIPSSLDLPTDLPRPPQQIFQGALDSFTIPAPLSASLKTLSQQEGVTLFMTLLAAFQVLLFRYSGQKDIVVGTPVAGRHHADLENLIGFFINTVALRSRLTDNATFRSFLAETRQTVMEGLNHQEMPFAQLVETLNPDRHLNHSPIFQVAFSVQNMPQKQAVFPGLTYDLTPVHSQTAKYDISLFIEETGSTLTCTWEYSTDLFTQETMRRMAGHYQVLLDALVTQPDCKIAAVPLLTAVEQQTLQQWHEAARCDFKNLQTVPEQLVGITQQYPEKPAIVAETQTMTFAELSRQANQLARFLQAQGVGQETVVGICLERSPLTAVAALAIWKAGGTYVPLDPATPPERLAFMLRDSQSSLLLTTTSLATFFTEVQTPVALLDAWSSFSVYAEDNLNSLINSEQLAYIIYTSGSTGQPKGVGITHGSLSNLVRWHQDEFDLTHTDKATLLAGPAFDASVWELWPNLTAGVTLFIPDETIRLSPEKMHDWLLAQQITITFQPSPLADKIIYLPWPDDTPLRYILTGGDVLHHYPPRTLPFTLVNNYGPTENTVVATSIKLTQEQTPLPPIGKAMSNAQIHLLDNYLQPVPVGVVGELYIGGAGLARGYWRRPQLTAVQFIPNPFSKIPGSRLYRTGDLARNLPDGTIEFMGRVDHQVKIRGFRIELGEIEMILSQHPSVDETAVLIHETNDSEKQLIAYTVLTDVDLTPEQLRTYLQTKLPTYMVPAAFITVPAIPLTANGKVDRDALPTPEDVDMVKTTYVAPETAVQHTLATIWQTVLKRDRIGIHDNFFELGGHSLLATQIVTRVREQLQQNLPLLALFQHPTIVGLAEILTPQPVATAHAQIDTTLREKTQQRILQNGQECIALPTSFAQQRLWSLDHLEPDSAAYNIPFLIQLQGTLDKTALQDALTALISRHESLRTTFAMLNESPAQIIHPAGSRELPLVTGDQIEQKIVDEARRPFDLVQGPLLRTTLYQKSNDTHLLLLVCHHIITDGWSMSILLNELVALYEAYAKRNTPSLPPLPIQYADYALWQRTWLQGEDAAKQLEYWHKQLADAPATLEFPLDKPRPTVQTFVGDTVSFVCPRQLENQLKTVSQDLGITPFMVGLSALYLLLHRYTGQTDIVVGSPAANRTSPEQETLIGFFINMLALRIDLTKNLTTVEFLTQVRDTVIAAQNHQEIPFERLVNDLGLERNLSHSPLFQVSFMYEAEDGRQIERPFLTWTARDFSIGLVKYDLMFALREQGDELAGIIAYNRDLFSPETMQRLAANWQNVLSYIVTQREQPIQALPLLSTAERQQILDWTDTQIPYPKASCVHQLFEEQAALAPHQTALIFNGTAISYQTLNHKANQLAHTLRRLGATPETLVALSVERSVEMVVGMLAILKAGAAYLPLDAAYPAERLAFMLRDGKVPILLTQQSLRDRLPTDESTAVLCLDSDWGQLADTSTANLEKMAVSTNLAYVMYTSGSTGQPKGVAVTHQNIVRLVKEANFASLSADETFLQYAPISFDAATLEIWGSLLNGSRLAIAPPHQLSLAELTQFIKTERVTTLWLTAGLFHLAVDDYLSELKGVRQLLAGGDVLSLPRVQRVLQELPDCQLINGYGPTENTTFTTCCSLSPTETFETSVPIGKPVSNTQVYVLDENLELTPIGVVGELYTGGDGLSRGYLNQPGLTAVSFIPHPFAEQSGERLYRTGDLVRWLPNGRLEFMGRRDHQVKIRGYRIEQGEIETILSQHPQVRQGVVVARTAASGSKYLTAYVLPEGNAASTDDLKQYLGQRLPDYMVPTAWVQMEALPLNANGKVDRQALPEASPQPKVAKHISPVTSTEQLLAQIWSDVLGITPIDMHDNFFELGGDSILCIRIAAKAKEAGLPMTMQHLFQHQTIAELAAILEMEQETAVTPSEELPHEPMPLTSVQHWFFEQNLARPDHWNMAILLQCERPLQKEHLEQTIAALAAHHDALRIRFISTESGWQQQLHTPENSLYLQWFDGVTDTEALIAEHQATLSIKEGLLFRAAYFDRGNRPHQLLLVVHHLVIDGVSWRILLEDLQTVYSQVERGTAVSLPAKTTNFLNWSHTLSTYAQEAQFTKAIEYWLNNNATPDPMPLDNPQGDNTVSSEAVLSFELTTAETDALLHEAPSAYNTRIDDILLTAFTQAYAAWADGSSVLVNMEGHGREEILPNTDITRTVGWFTTIYPVYLQLSGTGQLGDDLKAIKEQLRQIPDKGLPYGLLRYLHPDHTVRGKLAERETAVISFNYLGQFNEQTKEALFHRVDGASATVFAPENQRAHILDVGCIIRNQQLSIYLHYSQDIHREQTIRQLGDVFITCLRNLISHCQSPQTQGYTPSDFDKIQLNQNELDDILAELDDIL